MKKKSHGSKDYLLPFPHLREAALVAHHEEGRRVVAAHKIVEVERVCFISNTCSHSKKVIYCNLL